MSTPGKARLTSTIVASVIGVLALGTPLYLRSRPALATSEPVAAVEAPRTAPPPVEEPEPVALPVAVDPAERAEHDRRVTEAMRTVDITTYGAVWCPSCKAAHKWFDEQGIAYVDKDVEKSDADNKAMRVLNPKGTMPTIDIEGQVLVGFSPRAIEHAIRRAAEKRVR